jgi:hypothetical protein
MYEDTVILFTRNGLGSAPQELQSTLVVKFLELTLLSEDLPAKMIFYTEGAKLCCEGSPVLDQLQQFEDKGVELVLCATCLDFFGIRDQVKIGIIGGMGDILTALQMAPRVLSV